MSRSYALPFIVDAPAPMLRRHKTLSKNARHLYMTMRSLADRRTGELRINGRWLGAKIIDSAAEVCKNVRMPAMRELVLAGLVTHKRDRVVRIIRGRKRELLGPSCYTVHVNPVKAETEVSRNSGQTVQTKPVKPPVLLRSISCTIQKSDPQVLSEPPTFAPGMSGAGLAGGRVELVTGQESSSPQSQLTADDDSYPLPDWERIEAKIEHYADQARCNLVRKGFPAHFVDAAIQCVLERSDFSGSVPCSANYFEVAFASILADPRSHAMVQKRASRRLQMMPCLPELAKHAAELEHDSIAAGVSIRQLVIDRGG